MAILIKEKNGTCVYFFEKKNLKFYLMLIYCKLRKKEFEVVDY